MLLKCDKRELIANNQFYVDQDIVVNEAKEVISIEVEALLLSLDKSSKESEVNYRLTYKVIYLSIGASIEIEETSYDYKITLKNNHILPTSIVDINIAVLQAEYVGSSNIKIRTMLETSGFVVKTEEIELADYNADHIKTKTESIMLENIWHIKDADILVSSDDCKLTDIDRILTYKSCVVLKSVSAATDIVNISGECYTTITYITDNTIAQKDFVIPFFSEIMANGVSPDTKLLLRPLVKSTTLTVSENKSLSKVEIVIAVGGIGITEVPTKLIKDAYSINSELMMTKKDISWCNAACYDRHFHKFNASLDIDGGNIKTVLAHTCPYASALGYADSKELIVEGVISSEIIYLDKDNKVTKTIAEIPYKVLLDSSFPCKENIIASATVTAYNTRARQTGNIDINGELCVSVWGNGIQHARVVVAIKDGAPIEPVDVAISLYISSDGESLFDVAKELLTSEEVIIEQNPDITEPLSLGQKIIVFRKHQ